MIRRTHALACPIECGSCDGLECGSAVARKVADLDGLFLRVGSLPDLVCVWPGEFGSVGEGEDRELGMPL